jgi:hypothetical protein
MDVDNTAPADELAKVKLELEKSAHNYTLHQKRVELAKQLGLTDELEAARTDWADRFPLSEGVCLILSLVSSLYEGSDMIFGQDIGWNGSMTGELFSRLFLALRQWRRRNRSLLCT